jgi:adenylate cyclase
LERRLAAILAADVVGYSKLMGEDETGTLAALRELRTVLFHDTVTTYRGDVVKSMGDGWLVEFSSVVDAVNCAIQVQEKLTDHEIIKLRIGVHIGDIVHEDEDVYGDGVNIAARLQENGVPGGVLISNDVRRQLDGRGKANFAMVGELTLKNIAEPVKAAIWPAATAPKITSAKDETAASKPALTVTDFTGRGEDELIAQGIKEDLIAVLSQQSGFDYVLDSEAADYAIKGTVRSVGIRCRVSASMLDLTLKRQIWAAKYEVDPSDPFEVQDDCVYRICSSIRTFLWGEEGRKVAARPIDGLNANELLSLGSYYFEQQTVASFFTVYGLMDRILENEPENFMALAMSAMGATMSEFTYGYGTPAPDVIEEAKSRSERALRANSNSDFAYYVQAFVDLFLRHEYHGAVLAARRSIEINPNFSFGHCVLSFALSLSGHYTDGNAAAEQALASEPDNPFFHIFLRAKALGLFGGGQYGEAAELFSQSDKLLPGLPQNLLGMAACYWQLNEHQNASNAIARLLEIAPEISARVISFPPFKDASVINLMRKNTIAAGLPK